ncbi:hypothetical protein PR048_006893 [Dryococelus australis]|uniref:Uncharacterized protein n=1 Tax=Dryococelus australis TaxID=614101 RepID=A0ABQ9IDJ2_9NEOP|nr:hypothetical protein PR048_006893 [Dryococelus australis]
MRFSVAVFVILLTTSAARTNGDEVDPVGETGDEGYDLKTEFLRQQQLKLAKFLKDRKWPNQDGQSESYQKNSIHIPWYEVYLQKLANKYRDSINEMSNNDVQREKEFSPPIIGDEIGSEIFNDSVENYNYNDVGVENYDIEVSNSSLDQIVDFLLDLVNREIVEKGKDQIPVPNMSEEFEKRVGFIKLHGKFDAQNGWFKNLSTIQTTGDVVATRRGLDTLVITCEIGLEVMQFGFESYQANLAGISVRGHMTGSVASNSITLQLAATVDGGKCNVSLERLTMDQFDGVNVDLTGLGSLSWLLHSIADWTIKHFKDNIVSSIENNLRSAITGMLTKYHCSEFANLLRGLPEEEIHQDVSVLIV